MTLTSLDAINILYIRLKASALLSGLNPVNGGLYKSKRPMQSDKEDVVINSLPLNREQLQEGLINVNIYVPNLSIKINGVTDNSQPDIPRLLQLSTIASALFPIHGPAGEYSYILQQDMILEDTNNQHYINLRIEFYNTNI